MARSRRGRWQSFKTIVQLWVDLFDEHELLTSATAIALQGLVAAVALALLGIALLGELGAEGIWNNQIAPQIEPKVLPEVFGGIDASVQKVFSSSSAGLIAVALVLSIWEVSGVVRACMSAFSKIYGTKDERPFWIRFPISFGIALVLILALGGATLLTLGLRHTVHGGWGFPFAVLRWLATVTLLSVAFGVLVRFAPADRRSKRWASGGAALVVVLWIVQSLIFDWYVRGAANYKTAVGSLTFVYLFTTYFYVAGIVLLVGIELDELLRKDLQGEKERGILELARDVIT
ncbi:MAG TPA: YihY/virulence factor BrkB family protein [Gaiellaceae bacterium]|nr:YihY/virulence factor BrkB family protein [Gaiellaceae bacterium]